jgi:hypothetical protein
MRQLLLNNAVGLMLTHVSQRHQPTDDDWIWAADNACFTGKTWDSSAWLRWLESKSNPSEALFATIPDVVGSHTETLAKWPLWSKQVKDLGYKIAFILQNGCTSLDVPWGECDAVFIGGNTEWKLGKEACLIVAEAKRRGHWVHMGRVNSLRRMQTAQMWGCDSVDGTYLAFGPDVNTPKLVKMMQQVNSEPVFAIEMYAE